MKISPLAGKLAPSSILVNIPNLINAYYNGIPDPSYRLKEWHLGPQDIAVLP